MLGPFPQSFLSLSCCSSNRSIGTRVLTGLLAQTRYGLGLWLEASDMVARRRAEAFKIVTQNGTSMVITFCGDMVR